MQDGLTSSNIKQKPYVPRPETLALLRESGNPINGLGETAVRGASPFFWHPPDQHPFGDLQLVARQSSRKCPGATEAFAAAYNHPELCPVAADRRPAVPEQLAEETMAFALSHGSRCHRHRLGESSLRR